jgi:hypothetical protein
MTKKPTKSTPRHALAPTPSKPDPIKGTGIVPDVVYSNGRLPEGQGPWLGERDKIAWTDKETGYDCVILREPSGHLGGHVGVPQDHPLAGYAVDALPFELRQGLHNQISYSAACQAMHHESTSICHVSQAPDRSGGRVPDPKIRRRDMNQARQPSTAHDHAWWIGFECNGPTDFSPCQDNTHIVLMTERAGQYRDEGFVYRQVVELARRLKAFADADRQAANPTPKLTGEA